MIISECWMRKDIRGRLWSLARTGWSLTRRACLAMRSQRAWFSAAGQSKAEGTEQDKIV